MIIDTNENAHLYLNLFPNIKTALNFIKNTDFTNIEDGKYNIGKDNLFYIVQRYQTKPFVEGKLEAHKKYIDLQYVVKGKELIGHSMLDNLEIAEPYKTETDIVFYRQPKNINIINLTLGMFGIFFPHDAHMPCRYLDHPDNVLKIVLKIPSSSLAVTGTL